MGVKMVAPGGPRNSSVPTIAPVRSLPTSTGAVHCRNARSQFGKVAASNASASAPAPGPASTSIDTPPCSARSTVPRGAWNPRRSATRSSTP
jgi:hypothetical protein